MRPKQEDLQLLAVCFLEVKKICVEAKVVLFGSRARGIAFADSDMDLLILLPDSVDIPACEEQIHRSLYALSLESDIVISALVYSRSGWNDPVRRASPFHQAVSAEGISA